MTDLATAEPSTETPSTVLDADTPTGPSGAGAPRSLPDDEAKAPSLRDTVAAAVKEDAKAKEPDPADTKDTDKDADPPKSEAKTAGEQQPKDDAKTQDTKEPAKGPERGADGKFAAKEATTDAPAETKPAQDKASGHIEPPKSFLPDARELWRNAPRPVQRDVENMVRQHEAEVTRLREAGDRYEPIRAYDDLARQNGKAGVHESLAEVAQLEQQMQTNPLAALNRILMQAGPRKADGQPISLFELAQAIVNSGQDGYQRMVAAQSQQPAAQRQPDPEVASLRAQLAQIQEQQLAATIIEPFRAANPRYDELESDIAFFLQSDKIPTSLSPSDRLAAAYDMAVRINPASHDNDAAPQMDPEPARRAETDFSGSKSIKSAPGAVSAEMEPERGGSIQELLRDELRRSKRS